MNEIVISSIIFAVSLFYYIMSYGMSDEISSYPRGLIILMMIMSGYLAVKNIYNNIKKGEKPQWNIPEKYINLIIGSIAFVLYILTLNILGYIISTAVFYYAWMTIIRKGTVVKNLITTIGLVFAIYLLFGFFLKVPLPEGILF